MVPSREWAVAVEFVERIEQAQFIVFDKLASKIQERFGNSQCTLHPHDAGAPEICVTAFYETIDGDTVPIRVSVARSELKRGNRWGEGIDDIYNVVW